MTSGTDKSRGDATADLSIGDLVAATGVAAATLRTWELRHGFPQPQRLEGGHRRYRSEDVKAIEEVARRRDTGQTLPAAISAVLAEQSRAEPSVFAGLRRRHPHLVQRQVRKPTALALTRAIEDECCARAEQPLLFAGFQTKESYRQSRARWKEISRTARASVVFADFGGKPHVPRGHTSLHIPIPADSPLRREWILVCESADLPACLVAWEVPAHPSTPDHERRFEVVWTVEPPAVRDAALICADLVARLAPKASVPPLTLDGIPAGVSADLRRAQGVLDRTLAYLDAAT